MVDSVDTRCQAFLFMEAGRGLANGTTYSIQRTQIVDSAVMRPSSEIFIRSSFQTFKPEPQSFPPEGKEVGSFKLQVK